VAEQKIKELMAEEKDVVGLRVYVRGGGCHGYQYGMAFESKMAEDDTIIEKGNVKLIMDSQSAPLLQGAEVDYVDSVQGSGFSIKNPQAKTTCGCGSSSKWPRHRPRGAGGVHAGALRAVVRHRIDRADMVRCPAGLVASRRYL